jgi:hypothetical protein
MTERDKMFTHFQLIWLCFYFSTTYFNLFIYIYKRTHHFYLKHWKPGRTNAFVHNIPTNSINKSLMVNRITETRNNMFIRLWCSMIFEVTTKKARCHKHKIESCVLRCKLIETDIIQLQFQNISIWNSV